MAWDWSELGYDMASTGINWEKVAYGADFIIDEGHFDSDGILHVARARVISASVSSTEPM